MAKWQSSASGWLDRIAAKKVSLPLSFVGSPTVTKTFGPLGDIAEIYEDEAMLFNYHNYGINPDTFFTNDGIRDFYDLTSIMYTDDEAATPFVGSIEAKDYPFFGYAFHPEKPANNPKNNYGLNRTEESLVMNEYFFRHFATYARQNPKSKAYMSTQPKLIQNYDSAVGTDYWGHVYLF